MGKNNGTDQTATDMESPEFLERLRSFEPAAYRDLVRGYENRVYSLAYRLMKNAEDAEEVLQETFMSIFSKIHTFQERSRLSTWIYAITSNAAFTRLRKKSERYVTFPDDEVLTYQKSWFRNHAEDFEKDWKDPVLNRELSERLDEAIDSLPEGYREIFILKEIQEMSVKDIGAVFDIKPGAVKTRLHRARLMLRAKLSDYWISG